MGGTLLVQLEHGSGPDWDLFGTIRLGKEDADGLVPVRRILEKVIASLIPKLSGTVHYLLYRLSRYSVRPVESKRDRGLRVSCLLRYVRYGDALLAHYP